MSGKKQLVKKAGKNDQPIIGELFEKYPEVKSISWDQWTSLDGYFGADPWSVYINGKSYHDTEHLTAQEDAAAIELEQLIKMALGGEKNAGIIDHKTPTAINTNNLLRAIFGNNVLVTVSRTTARIRQDPSRGRICDENQAKFAQEEDAREAALRAHLLDCHGCDVTVDDEKMKMGGHFCEAGSKLAEAVADDMAWELSPAKPVPSSDKIERRELTDQQFEQAQAELGRKVLSARYSLGASAHAKSGHRDVPPKS